MPSRTNLCALALSTLLLSGCAFGQKTVVNIPPPEPCAADLERISSTSFGDQSADAIRRYLGCLVLSGSPPPVDIERKVADELDRNPYPAARRDAPTVLARFFDKDRMKKLPERASEIDDYADLLEDQALTAKAIGDMKLATAAETRARKLRRLNEVVQLVEQ